MIRRLALIAALGAVWAARRPRAPRQPIPTAIEIWTGHRDERGRRL